MSGDDRRRRDPAPLVGSLHVGEGGTGVRVEVGAAPEPRHSTLPNQSGKARFSGRRGDLAAVIDAFAEPDRPAVLVLHGDPGVGKSRLAIEYGEKHRARYPGGTFFVDMSLTPSIWPGCFRSFAWSAERPSRSRISVAARSTSSASTPR
jgi:hypothetical protein